VIGGRAAAAAASRRAAAAATATALAAAWFAGTAWAADPLGRLAVDAGQISVAGISSGAFMANQLHVAHSADIMGAGIVAGGLFGCAVDSVTADGVAGLASLATGPCMSAPGLLQPAEHYAGVVAELAGRGWIDPPGNLARSRVYLFTGRADSVVAPGTVERAAALYRALGVPQAQLKFDDQDRAAGHSWVTQGFGNACDANASPYINNCGYDQSGDLLQTIYGPLQPPATQLQGRIVAFDQAEFVAGGAVLANGLWHTGYVYVPQACEAGAAPTCRLAIVLHGCLQSAETLGAEFYSRIGVNEWADTNRIVALYPQAHATTPTELARQDALALLNANPAGCWNWWGYAYDTRFPTRQGVQVGALWSMVQRLAGQGN
jgi:poly(3-hydroxybutyrate) depolymerase